MILCDKTIRLRVEKDALIEPFNESQLTPNGYDLAIEKIVLNKNKEELIPKPDGVLSIPARSAFVVLTKEKINMPGDLAASIWIKTGRARPGLDVRPGMIDAGFKGNLNIFMTNVTDDFVDVNINNTIAQLVFFKLDECAEKTYEKRSGNYQNQNKVIL